MAFVSIVFVTCYYPLSAWKTDSGEIVFQERKAKGGRELSLACGQCVGCRLKRSRDHAIRCMHEASMHDSNSFITLTYDDDHCPDDLSLCYSHFQLFMKRVRKKFKMRVRFYMCGEYGEDLGRPHFHAILFGAWFSDRYPWRLSPSGFQLYRSSLLESLWTYGNCEIGDVTFESAAYIARYCMKKVTGDKADEHYKVVDSDTGEIFWRVPEFNRMSLKPGIGAEWFAKYRSEVFPLDRVVVNGSECRPPKYYKRLLDSLPSDSGIADLVDGVDFRRYLSGVAMASDNTRERLRVKEVVAKSKIKTLLRKL